MFHCMDCHNLFFHVSALDIWVVSTFGYGELCCCEHLCAHFLYGHMVQVASPWTLLSFFGSSVFVSVCRGACPSKSLAISFSFLLPYCFSIELNITSPRTLLRGWCGFLEGKGGLVEFPRLLDLNLRTGAAIYLSHNVCIGRTLNWERFHHQILALLSSLVVSSTVLEWGQLRYL